jgi:hypothetical protein
MHVEGTHVDYLDLRAQEFDACSISSPILIGGPTDGGNGRLGALAVGGVCDISAFTSNQFLSKYGEEGADSHLSGVYKTAWSALSL